MCGIVGYVGEREATPILLDCLKKLEYRGYDSAGIAVVEEHKLEVRRSAGKIAALESILERQPMRGSVGVAHTRWATHGRPTDDNAHPHRDCSGSLAVVHNGIIENHGALRSQLESRGHRFASETDSEVVAHLIESEANGDLAEGTLSAARQLEGAYALGVVSRDFPDRLVAVRNGGPPLVVGLAGDGCLLASDVTALLSRTRNVVTLDDGELAVLARDGVRVLDFEGRRVEKAPMFVSWDAQAAAKGGYPHFMLKEIFEQPRAIEDTYRDRVDLGTGEVLLPELGLDDAALAAARRVVLLACGTSYHAGLVGRHLIEALAGVPAEVDLASEFRYRPPVEHGETLALALSQSGETADTLGAAREASRRGSRLVAICNVVGSTLARESSGVLYTRAGPEIGVASTKAFTTQLVALFLFALRLARARGALSRQRACRLLAELTEMPRLACRVLSRDAELKDLARRFHDRPSFLYLARGIDYPLAMEGALKLKEISYIHAEAYAAGEMKHGPIALIDRTMPVVVIAPAGRLYEKTFANIEEVKAREGIVIALASEGDDRIAGRADYVFRLPRTSEQLFPLLVAMPLQLLAYHAAILRGCDVDQPRNLAKSVTVE